VCNDASKLGRVPFDFDQSSAKRCLLLAFRQRLFQQASETVLLSLNPEEILNLLACARAWNLGVQKRAPQKLSSGEPSGIDESFETGDVFVGDAHTDEMT
jgi:hypothetical protein